MGKPYTGTTRLESLGWVKPGSFVVLRVKADEAASRDAFGRWPHLLYRPGENAGIQCGTFNTNLAGDRETIEYEDDGQCFYCPLAGGLYVTGGAGRFDITVRADREAQRLVDVSSRAALDAAERRLVVAGPEKGFWKLTSYTQEGSRLTGIPVPLGARWASVTSPSDIEITNNLAAAESLTNVDTTAEVPIDFATTMAFTPRSSNGFLVLHGCF
jgi:hypothetical protein